VAEQTIGLVVHPSRPVLGSVATIAQWARHHGVALMVAEQDFDRLRRPAGVTPAPPEEVAAAADALVSLGGDGTMLGAMRLVASRPVPVLGVNHGHLGFLIEVDPSQLDDALQALIDGNFEIEPQSCLRVLAAEEGIAFNDLVLCRGERGRAVSVDLTVNGDRYGYYRCDAVVVATPTGSTAYSYAAGGPVVSPSVPAVTVTPVAPISGISRSVVLGAGDAVRLRLPTDVAAASMELDGVPAGSLEPGQGVDVELVPEGGLVVRLDARRHAERNRVKLSLLDLPLRQDQLLDLVPLELREHGAHRLQRQTRPGGTEAPG
jgi:NAD+ kinase